MGTRPVGPQDPDGYSSDTDEDTDSLGIGSVTVADLAELLGGPTDENPILQDDDIFV